MGACLSIADCNGNKHGVVCVTESAPATTNSHKLDVENTKTPTISRLHRSEEHDVVDAFTTAGHLYRRKAVIRRLSRATNRDQRLSPNAGPLAFPSSKRVKTEGIFNGRTSLVLLGKKCALKYPCSIYSVHCRVVA